MHKLGRVALWVSQAALALMFLRAGGAKFGSPMWPRMFERWGYPDHFYLIVGAVEVAAGLALLVPRLASPASIRDGTRLNMSRGYRPAVEAVLGQSLSRATDYPPRITRTTRVGFHEMASSGRPPLIDSSTTQP